MPLESFFAAHPRVAVAFSGGVDSAYLLYAAKTAGCDAAAYFLKTPFQPRFELEDAQKLAGPARRAAAHRRIRRAWSPRRRGERAAALLPLQARALHPAVGGRARRRIRGALRRHQRLGRRRRPAGHEGARGAWGALPLREAGLSKPEIRRLSREAGLFTHDKPAYACLATRVPTGTPITPGLLEKTERAENALFSLGFTDFRVRLFCGAARIQLPEGQLSRALLARQSILDALSPDFDAVLLDLRPRG